MKDLTDRLAADLLQSADKYLTSISVSNFRTNTPRVNFRKIKLNKFQNLYNNFKLSDLDLSEHIIGFVPVRETQSLTESKEIDVSPLRKKNIEEEKPPLTQIEEEIKEPIISQPELSAESLFSLSDNFLDEDTLSLQENIETVLKPKNIEDKTEDKSDITFNLEAQIVQDDDNALLTPSLPSTAPIKDDLISSSGEQTVFVWPPVSEKKASKKNKNLKSSKAVKKVKKKPYFLSQEDKSSSQQKEIKVTDKPIAPQELSFPWALSPSDAFPVEEVFSGGLESELLEIPVSTEKSQSEKSQSVEQIKPIKILDGQKLDVEDKLKNIPTPKFSGEVIYKAISPIIAFESLPENVISDSVKGIGWFGKLLDKFNKLEFGIVVTGKDEKRTGKMFERFGYKLTPIRIIILGGALATLGYSAWNYLLPIINNSYNSQTKHKVIIRDLFETKKNHGQSKVLIPQKETGLQMSELLEEKTFSPITEEERLSLIQMAREALEARLDPFGQEAVLPREVIQQKIAEQMDAGPLEIPIIRKQVELVGVISSNNKNLALVNVYDADYSIIEDDDKATRDSKLKTALSMAVPNRLEVSLLDAVEDWYVKQIIKAKTRSDDPIIELVKGDKKFKLKVGQKVLLPVEKPPEEPKSSDDMDTPKG